MLQTLISRKSSLIPHLHPQIKMSTLSAKKERKEKKSSVVSWGLLSIFDHVIISMTNYCQKEIFLIKA